MKRSSRLPPGYMDVPRRGTRRHDQLLGTAVCIQFGDFIQRRPAISGRNDVAGKSMPPVVRLTSYLVTGSPMGRFLLAIPDEYRA
jgi:hypothetical protein